jgi:hypothetical protein
MEPADSIGRLGFSRWYERRLIEGHAWFVSGFICMILVFACVEELTFKGSLPRLLGYLALVVAAIALCVYGMFRYQAIIVEAERIGERATCPGCGVYARFRLHLPATARCRKCAHEWQLIP